jgi:hypothetical protein
MKTKVDRTDKIYTILICFCLLVIACVETLTSGILKKTEAQGASVMSAQATLSPSSSVD